MESQQTIYQLAIIQFIISFLVLEIPGLVNMRLKEKEREWFILHSSDGEQIVQA